ncbi:hypothetical protein OUY36_08570 [Stutzerimonas sp. R40042]|uniref:hypothetical protein n=1 Tax=Stutzerimonas TaxID=2901164 RepID=UPI0022797E59|nr:hypothetical protein [Stutzerimonas sp. R40042]WAE63597.1 hypothetical protein OUY36_08570 [Stutzerimonas sp. R40042]
MHSKPPLVRLNLHLRNTHLDRLTTVAQALAKRKGRDTRLAEALELALAAAMTWTDADLLSLAQSDREAPHWAALGPVIRTR